MKKKVFTVLLTLIMIMALCACSTSAADEENKPAETTKTEEIVEEKESTVNAEDSAVANSEENKTINEEVNEFGISENELDSLYKKMSETVIIEYLEPNDILPEDFTWPPAGTLAWSYLGEKILFHDSDMDIVCNYIDFVPENELLLMDAITNGFFYWISENEITSTGTFNNIYSSIRPLDEVIPNSLDLTIVIEDNVTETEPATEETGDSSAP